MADIFDLIPPREYVEIGDTKTEIRAIDLGQALTIMTRFPALGAIITGGKQSISLGDLLRSGSVPAIIAAGLVNRREGDEEQMARLDADTQAMMLIPILRLTMPRGLVPFLTRVAEFVTVLSPSPGPTREEIASELVRRSSRKQSPLSSSNTEELSTAIAS